MPDSAQRTLRFPEAQVARFICGQRDANLRLIERSLEVSIGARGEQFTVSGSPHDVELATILLEQLYQLGHRGIPVHPADISRALNVLSQHPDANLYEIFGDTVFVSARKKSVSPKGLNQKRYVDAIRRHDVVFGVGPAGTGKTFLAMAMALRAFFDRQLERIILVRPAVEAGEKLGFLPGDLVEKVNPYLRPLYDAIREMVDAERAEELLDSGAIEVAPLAFMRGRTLNDAFIILDEAQNTTPAQMKMFLTRIGFGSKAVITGDITQIDLPSRSHSGLVQASHLLRGINGIQFVEFSNTDVVRHPLVQQIIQAYESGNAS